MAASTDVTFWAYTWYLMNNPNKTNPTRQDIHRMAEQFAATNSDEVTSATDPGGTYTDIEWPGANAVTAVGNSSTTTEDSVTKVNWEPIDLASKKTLDQAAYPESLLAGT